MSNEHLLVTIGRERFNSVETQTVHFVDDPNSNAFLNDLENYPHAFVLACCMDRQTKAERAWMIPMKIKELLGDFSMVTLSDVTIDAYKELFNKNNLHRFNDVMAEVFYKAVQRIMKSYECDASRIWENNPSSAAVVYKFLQFDGVGIKIATMATNILARQFKIPFSDLYSIDISPDVHILRVLRRTGLVEKDASIESIIYKARELYPEFPGIIDFSCWEIGRSWCRPQNPNCGECIIKNACERQI